MLAWAVSAFALAVTNGMALPAAAQAATPTGQPAEGAAPAAPAGADTGLPPICADRPTKSTGACTVDAGHFQLESDIVNGTFQRLDGVTTDTWFATNPTLKFGLTPDLDVEANLSPLEVVRTHDKFGGGHTIAGLGDLYLRMKYEFVNTTGGGLQLAVIPYVKAPTARPGIGDGAVEGGAIVPINVKISDLLSITFDPEVDILKNAQDDGRHANMAQVASLAFSLTQSFSLYGELWGDWSFDPSGEVQQYSADVAASYIIGKYLQLDGGLNFGLNHATPGVQAYVGVSQKF